MTFVSVFAQARKRMTGAAFSAVVFAGGENKLCMLAFCT
jgi:hypothetical protein